MFKTDILFTGYYGQRNTGDDAFVEVCSWGANKFWKKNKNKFLAINEFLPNIINGAKGFPLTIPRSYFLQNKILLNNTKYLISGGGSTIHSAMNSKNPKELAVGLKSKGKKIKIGAIGVSIGPFKTSYDEKAIIEYLKNIDFVATRDQRSFDFLSTLKLPYDPINAFDLAALLPEIYKYNGYKTKHLGKKIIGISVCPYESLNSNLNFNDEEKRHINIVDLIRKIDQKDNVHFRFYVINGNLQNGDYNLTIKTIEDSKPSSFEIYNYNKTIEETWHSISDCDFIISTRLHAAIFACFADVPFMLNEYHRKCEDFLYNVGYFEHYRLYNNEFDINSKANQIIEIINDKNMYVKPTKSSQMQELAKRNFTAINI